MRDLITLYASFLDLGAGSAVLASAPLKVLSTIDAHDYIVLHCKKPNPSAILFKFPVQNITINI
jgi:hypothetical protein